MTVTNGKFAPFPEAQGRFNVVPNAAKDAFGLCEPLLTARWIRAVSPDQVFYCLSFCGSCLNIARKDGARSVR